MGDLLVLVGLPRAGKSTLARRLGFPVVCPDEIRLALHGQPYAPAAEPMVWAIAEVMAKALLGSGAGTVTIDATNCTTERRAFWTRVGGPEVRFAVVEAEPEECVRRALAGGRPDLAPVIERMAAQWDYGCWCGRPTPPGREWCPACAEGRKGVAKPVCPGSPTGLVEDLREGLRSALRHVPRGEDPEEYDRLRSLCFDGDGQ